MKKPVGTFYSLEQLVLVKPIKKSIGRMFDDENAMTRIDMSEYQELIV
jgi:hypothetical protein